MLCVAGGSAPGLWQEQQPPGDILLHPWHGKAGVGSSYGRCIKLPHPIHSQGRETGDNHISHVGPDPKPSGDCTGLCWLQGHQRGSPGGGSGKCGLCKGPRGHGGMRTSQLSAALGCRHGQEQRCAALPGDLSLSPGPRSPFRFWERSSHEALQFQKGPGNPYSSAR